MEIMHQSFATPVTLGPGKCRGLQGVSTVILLPVVQVVPWLCRAFDFQPNIARRVAD